MIVAVNNEIQGSADLFILSERDRHGRIIVKIDLQKNGIIKHIVMMALFDLNRNLRKCPEREHQQQGKQYFFHRSVVPFNNI